MNDDIRFDRELSDGLSAITPPDSTIEHVTPWRRAMGRIVTGFILTSFTFNLLYLQYILPAVGTVMMFLGFRTLRRSNGWFKACHILSAVGMVHRVFLMLYLTTPMYGTYETELTVFVTALRLVLLICFHFALTEAHKSVGQTVKTRPALRAAVWYCAAVALAFSPLSHSVIAFIVMVVCYIGIIMSLNGAKDELDEWGYAVTAAPVRISDERVKQIFAAVFIAVTVGGLVWASHVPIDWQDAAAHTGAYEVREELIELGYPEELLSDVADEDLMITEKAVECEVDVGPLIGSNGNMSHEYRLGEGRLSIITVSVTMESGRVRVFTHFEWTETAVVMKNDYFSIKYDEDFKAYDIAGRLFCERWGKAREAVLDIDHGIKSYVSIFGDYTVESMTALPRWPKGADRVRGYAASSYEAVNDRNSFWYDFTYFNSKKLFRIPYSEPALGSGSAAQSYISIEGPFESVG